MPAKKKPTHTEDGVPLGVAEKPFARLIEAEAKRPNPPEDPED